MHDTNLEERLRSVLRQEGEGLPFTITIDELERRLAMRRRARNSQRLGLLAAGLAVVAVGSIFALGSGWLRGSNMATDPSPSSGIPAPTPTPVLSPRPTDPLGPAGTAILVTPRGEDRRRPDSFEVTRLDPMTRESVTVATIPGSVLPDDGWLDGGEGPPQISASGWLAVPFTRGPNEDDRGPAIAIIDTHAPDAAPWILDGYESMSWDPFDRLAIERDGIVDVAIPSLRSVESATVDSAAVQIGFNGRGIASGPAVVVDDSARFLATRASDDAAGYVSKEGAFTATDDPPPVYQRTGRERPIGAGGHGLGEACDGGAPGACYLIESDERHEPIETWIELDTTPLHDFAWAVDGKSVWLLLDSGTLEDGQVASLAFATSPGARVERALIDFEPGVRPAILGFAAEPAPGSATVVAIGDDQGFIRAFVLADGVVAAQDGTAWFAGWAGDPAPYDPD